MAAKLSLLFMILSLGSAFAQTGKWECLNPYPAEVDFNKILPVTENVIYAGGLSGSLIKSTDCGESWKLMKFNDVVYIKSICFEDSLKGFISDGDNLYSTDDGGINWNKITPDMDLSKHYIKDIAVFDGTIYLFITASVGMVEDMITAKSFIMKSTDQGNSWQTMDYEIKGELNCAYFISGSLGFISTSETISLGQEKYYFYKTADGGKTWQKIQIGQEAYCLYFHNENSGFAGRLKTTDGGNTWTDVFKEYPSNKYLVAMDFYDSLSGCALSEGNIYETSDGGLSWALKDPEGQSAGSHYTDVSYSKKGTQWITGWGTNLMRRKPGETKWKQLSRGTREILWDVCFVDKNEGWIIGLKGLILHTKDGGQSWDEQAGNVNSTYQHLRFLNNKEGYIVCDSVILNTTDGGLNWAVRNDIKLKRPYDIGFFDTQNGIMTGAEGIILKTSNGGKDWISATNKPITYPLGSIVILDKSSAWIASYQGLIHVTNKGESFQFFSMSEFADPMKSIQFIDSLHGFVVNTFSQVFMTSDGGWTWKEITMPYELRLRGPIERIYMLDKSTGYISWLNNYLSRIKIDETGTIVKIDDYGASRIESFSFPDKDHGWAVGVSGCILRYTADNSSAVSDEKAKHQNISSDPISISGANVKFILQNPQHVKVNLYNSIGQRVSSIYSGWLNRGENNLNWKKSGLSSGIYFLSVECNEFTRVLKCLFIN